MFKRRPRLEPSVYIGFRRYFLTFCTYCRIPAFLRPDSVEHVLDHFLRTRDSFGCEFLAYCFMPDHVHLIVQTTSADSDLTRWVKCAKQETGFWYRATHGQRLWQPSWYDHVFREDDDLRQYVCYLLDNPVRGGLVSHASDYPFVGSSIMSREDLFEMIESSDEGLEGCF